MWVRGKITYVCLSGYNLIIYNNKSSNLLTVTSKQLVCLAIATSSNLYLLVYRYVCACYVHYSKSKINSCLKF